MDLTSELCRLQEAHHRDRANSALLLNVRKISEIAAAAWAEQAIYAEKAEARQLIAKASQKADSCTTDKAAGRSGLI